MIVVDASVVLAAAVGDPEHGEWAYDTLARRGVVAPHLLPAEVANALRRLEARGLIDRDTAATTLSDTLSADIDLWPFAPFADRIWELRGAVSTYDAWYVALAETLEVPMATLDQRLVSANGPRCEFRTP